MTHCPELPNGRYRTGTPNTPRGRYQDAVLLTGSPVRRPQQALGTARDQRSSRSATGSRERGLPDRRIRTCENWPDCAGYCAQKTRFCRRPPFPTAEALAPVQALPVDRQAGICGDHAGCQRSTSDQPRPGSHHEAYPGTARVRRPAVDSQRSLRRACRGWPGLAEGKREPGGGQTRACLTVRARGRSHGQVWCAVAGGRVRRCWRWRRGGRLERASCWTPYAP